MLMSLHLSIASRVLLKYNNEFNEFVGQLAVEKDSTPAKVAGMYSELGFTKFYFHRFCRSSYCHFSKEQFLLSNFILLNSCTQQKASHHK
jgi:hypothetical protein